MTFLKKLVLSSMLTCSALWAEKVQNYTDEEISKIQNKINALSTQIKCDNAKIQALKWKDHTQKSNLQKLKEELEQLRKAKVDEEVRALKEQALLSTNQTSILHPSGDINTYSIPDNRNFSVESDLNKLVPYPTPDPLASLNPKDAQALVPYNKGYLAPPIAPNGQYRLSAPILTNIPTNINGYQSNFPNVQLSKDDPLVTERLTQSPMLALGNGEVESSYRSRNSLTENMSVSEDDIRTVLSGKSSYRLNQNTIYFFIYEDQLYSLVPNRNARGVNAEEFTQKMIGSLVSSKSKNSELYFKMSDKVEVIVYPNRSARNQMKMSFLEIYKVGLNAFNSECCPGEQFKFQFVKKDDLQLK